MNFVAWRSAECRPSLLGLHPGREWVPRSIDSAWEDVLAEQVVLPHVIDALQYHPPSHVSEKGVRLAQNAKYTSWPMHSCGNTATKG